MPLVMTNTSTSSSKKPLDPDDLFAIFDAAPSTDSSNENGALQQGQGDSKHQHKKTRSLVGFDPMLDTIETEKPSHSHASSNGSKVWSNSDASELMNDEHPLLSNSRGLSTTANKKTSSSKPPTASSHKSSKSVCVSDLQNIASQLSIQKPLAMTSDEERRITLGETTSDSISKKDQKLLKKKSHRKSQSLSEIIGLVPKKQSPPPTPSTRGKALVKAQASPQPTTPPRSTTNSTPMSSPKLFKHSLASKLSTPPRHHTKTTSKPDEINIPTLMKQSPTSFLRDNTMALRSSEQDPAPHQVSLPSAHDLLIHSKLCALLETYRDVDQNFDFNRIQGVNPLTLKGFVSLNHTIAGMTEQQKPIVQALLECHDDIIVEGYFTSKEGLEVGVFGMQNTYVVVYKGTPEQQLKPGRTKEAPILLDSENAAMVYPPVREAYFELESQVYTLLDGLLEENPFAHVTFVGHSFGAALGMLGAVRFASARPSLRFTSHTFGAPKVGGPDFVQLVNTLPNLKVVRVELPGDVNTTYPVDHASTKYQHAGHSLVLSNNQVLAYRFDAKKPPNHASMSKNFLRMQKANVHSYAKALEPFANDSDKQHEWVSVYVGQDVGKGVRGMKNEKRLMV